MSRTEKKLTEMLFTKVYVFTTD